MKKIGIIGFGVMGSAIYKALSKQYSKDDLRVFDSASEKLSDIDSAHRATSVEVCVENSDIVIICVKPQSFAELAKSIVGLCENRLVVSIMAGVTISRLKQNLGAKKVIRTMPNIGLTVGRGVVGWIADGIEIPEKDEIKSLFSLWGVEFEVEHEDMLDALTALSGSGPAYFYYLAEILQEKAQELGFGGEQSALVARETLIGASTLLEKSNQSPAALRAQVTSTGGTTEAALDHLKHNGFDATFKSALDKALMRAQELNK